MAALCILVITPALAPLSPLAPLTPLTPLSPLRSLAMQLAARVALLAALFVASVCARQRCSTDSVGNLRGQRVSLDQLSVPHRHTSIEIPNACPLGKTYVGMKISVCDNNGTPAVMTSSLYYAEVHLQGLPGNAVAYITEYCVDNVAGSNVDDVDDDLSGNSNPIAYELDSDE